jgi:predicted nucleotidyltransferase component of viral defense system
VSTHDDNQPSPASVRRSLGDRLRAEAKRRGRPTGDVRREFVFQRFLARLFTDPDCRWVLKGGTGLLVRIQQARYSKDIDLVVPGDEFDLDAAVDSLRADLRSDHGDHLTFAMDSVTRPADGQSAAMLRVTCYTGTTPFERFTIDLSTRTHVVAQPERVRPRPVIELAGTEPLPEFVLYPLPDQIADKVCAMYGRYGVTNRPSTRYRDLVDLVLITTTSELDALLTIRALQGETARRGCTLPAQIENPGPEWQASYARIARESNLPTELHALDKALEAARTCLDPVLAGTATGTWNPDTKRWGVPAHAGEEPIR